MEGTYLEYAMDIDIVYHSPKEEDNSVFLKGKCGKFDFELTVRFKSFPSEKERDEAYRVWVEGYLEAFVREEDKNKS